MCIRDRPKPSDRNGRPEILAEIAKIRGRYEVALEDFGGRLEDGVNGHFVIAADRCV